MNNGQENTRRMARIGPAVPKIFLETIPCSIFLWTLEHRPLTLNSQAAKLTGFSARDFEKDPFLWNRRIYLQDRASFEKTWSVLSKQPRLVTCDYRFLPKGAEKEIWIRDVSMPFRGTPDDTVQGVISACSDVSDLKESDSDRNQHRKETEDATVLHGLLHELKNLFQTCQWSAALLPSGQRSDSELLSCLRNNIDRCRTALEEFEGYVSLRAMQFTSEDLVSILEELTQELTIKLRQVGIRVRLTAPNSLPRLHVDLRQFRVALDRLAQFSRALLPRGGDLEIDARPRQSGSRRYVELELISSSASQIAVDEKEVFQPFLRVNGHDVGISMTLAQEILRRHNGEISFQKKDNQRASFTIRLKGLAD